MCSSSAVLALVFSCYHVIHALPETCEGQCLELAGNKLSELGTTASLGLLQLKNGLDRTSTAKYDTQSEADREGKGGKASRRRRGKAARRRRGKAAQPRPDGCVLKRLRKKIFVTVSKSKRARIGRARKVWGNSSFSCMSRQRKAWCYLGTGELKDHARAITYQLSCPDPKPTPKPEGPEKPTTIEPTQKPTPKPTPTPGGPEKPVTKPPATKPPATKPPSGPGQGKCALKKFAKKIFVRVSKASGAHIGMAKKMWKKGSFSCMSAKKSAWCHPGMGKLKDHPTAISYQYSCS